ncbi:MAG: hypothetical protein HRU00_11250 [Myxococcales bacterium]|nr:hypothetical protein [Myxococcales bacterium]
MSAKRSRLWRGGLVFVLAWVLPQAPSASFAQLVAQGEQLFNNETFNGNGRTCATCHVAAQSFGLTPAGIATLFASSPTDPLFIAETDPVLATLENSCLMRMGNTRGLILENIDGFSLPPNFRNSPHLFNLASTAPYGLSGEFADLKLFSTGAVMQHFTKTMARNAGADFTLPTAGELNALEAFMNSITFPADGNPDLNRMIAFAIAQGGDATAIAAGQALFFGPQAQCSTCHSGPVLADADGSLGTGTGNLAFDTGVVNLPANLDDGCSGGPGDPTLPLPAEDAGTRRFSTPALVGVNLTAPFFHDNSVSSLLLAVNFYDSAEFAASPAAARLPAPIVINFAQQNQIVAFLEAISVDPSVGLGLPALSTEAALLLVALLLLSATLLGVVQRRRTRH